MKSSCRYRSALLALAGLSLLPSAQAARLVDVNTLMRQPSANRPIFAGKAASSPARTGKEALPPDFKPVRSISLQGGKVITRYQQYFHGVPIWSQSVIEVRQPSISGKAATYSGKVVADIEQDLSSAKPVLSAAQVLDLVRATRGNGYPLSNERAELLVRLDRQNVAHLIYLVSFFVDAPHPSRPYAMVDANSGAVLKKWEGLTHFDATGPGGNGKTGAYEYGKQYGFLPVDDNCNMNNGSVVAVDLQSSKNTQLQTPFHFSCPRNTADRAVNGAYGPINDAFYFGNAVVKMYQEWLGLRPLNGTLYLNVHYGKRYENAFWNGSSMNFGDGGRDLYPLVSADVTGHEISHGFTEQNSGLIYEGQAGGINESFSDMAGAATENYVKGKNSWRVGDDITKGSKPLRYMDTPSADGASIDRASDYADDIDPHNSSGVYNKAFYLLANAPGWSVRQAFQVFADANRLYWEPESTYDQAACGVIRAAKERGYRDSTVAGIFKVVGVSCQP
jgi:Zn-dependent metalloprotease